VRRTLRAPVARTLVRATQFVRRASSESDSHSFVTKGTLGSSGASNSQSTSCTQQGTVRQPEGSPKGQPYAEGVRPMSQGSDRPQAVATPGIDGRPKCTPTGVPQRPGVDEGCLNSSGRKLSHGECWPLMPQSLAKGFLHLVFSTKNSAGFLNDISGGIPVTAEEIGNRVQRTVSLGLRSFRCAGRMASRETGVNAAALWNPLRGTLGDRFLPGVATALRRSYPWLMGTTPSA
jgi:hypothetical protein